ncbi:MAG: hypothetical protein DRJ65_00105 [Acidobacteria bacterium]|nr:MAG: hypothetical protein DRJ65_00105 [Acidobacteriota bacterium]
MTRRQFLKRISSVEDIKDELQSDQVSDRAYYLWEWYWEVKMAANNGMTNAITWTSVLDWMRVTCESVTPWESRVIIKMDAIARKTYDEMKPAKPVK